MSIPEHEVDCVWNVMAHAQKPDFVFQQNGRVHLSRRGRQFSRLLAAEVCASAVVMLYTSCSEVVWRILATHSIRQFPLHFTSRASPCVVTFQLDSTYSSHYWVKPPWLKPVAWIMCTKQKLYSRITSTTSLSFCMTTFSACLANLTVPLTWLQLPRK
jgi:hypothetical protein